MSGAGAPSFVHVANVTCTDCFEPAAAVDPDGRIFLAAHRLGGVAVSDDGGATFTVKPVPPPASPSPFAGGASDDLVQVAPWGSVYYTELWSDGGGILGAGVHIAASDDGGETWPLNVFVHIREYPTSGAFTSDRQWLAFDGDETVYLVFNCALSVVICLLKSEDRGATWGVPSIVMTPATHTFPSPAGFPTVGPDGTLIVPYFADPRPDPGLGARTIMVVSSTDGGVTFAHHTVYTHPLGEGTSGGGWPEATILADGSWVAAWTASDRVWFAFSADAGATWGEPTVLGPDENGDPTGHHPWLLGRADGGLDAVWFTAGPGVRLGRMAADGAWTMAQVPVAGGGQTDYPYFAHTPDGRVVIPFLGDDVLHVAFTDS
jgi:hypothetical protein